MQVLHSKIIIRRVKIECAPSKCSSNRWMGEFRKPMHPVQGRQEQEGTEGEGSLNGRKIQACVVIIINGNRLNRAIKEANAWEWIMAKLGGTQIF